MSPHTPPRSPTAAEWEVGRKESSLSLRAAAEFERRAGPTASRPWEHLPIAAASAASHSCGDGERASRAADHAASRHARTYAHMRKYTYMCARLIPHIKECVHYILWVSV